MWQTSEAIDGDTILDCQIHQTTDNPFLPKEYELQLKLNAKRKSDGLVFEMSIMYSVTNQLPELFFTCYKLIQDEEGYHVKTPMHDIDAIVAAAGFKGKSIEEKMFIVT